MLRLVDGLVIDKSISPASYCMSDKGDKRNQKGRGGGRGMLGLSGCMEVHFFLLTGMSGIAIQLAAQVSVRPKPCTTGQQKHTFRNSSTWLARGAPPVTINLTRPPSRALILAKTSLSKNGEACSTMVTS